MADIVDSASEIEELQRNNALVAHQLNRNAVSAEHCEDCGDPLSDERREAYPGCTMCVSCQGELELRNKQRGTQ